MPRRRKRRAGSIEDELSAIAADVTALGGAIGNVASAEVQEMLQSIRQQIDKVASDAGLATTEGMEVIADTIRERPIASVLIGFACGYLTAAIMRR
jgi:ElaB/YqjD/DUF883 family membrane-anchored ribosome-binding protein